ncbi:MULTISPECIES: RNA 3'-terminal phosphate cyclase [unclassified Psychrobacter]|uniref:RNA 3'-terminal phosphate cyclase n=1 Tax=unclassified Psychrobacter TaxID=196806 RepID=UPI0018F40AB9|nr:MULTISPECIES: RNA 3'-terminal phosphate cyclase [unclassified Psychrobacter]
MPASTHKTLKIDGSTGEGGGQIVRSALTLSMLTGTPIQVRRIRAGRAKSGLMRQHLMCVQAAQTICNAEVSGAALGSDAFSFTPQAVRAGDYHFDIGSAGSTSLVLQTILPALLFADSRVVDSQDVENKKSDASSTVTIIGGTHNPLAPTTDFLQHAFVPLLAKLGMQVEIECVQAGFAPIGGGVIKARITPFLRRAGMPRFELTERGALQSIVLCASVLNLDYSICTRELTSIKASLLEADIDEALMSTQSKRLDGIGEGNTCFAIVTHQLGDKNEAKATAKTSTKTNTHQEVFSLLGEKRSSAENIGKRLAGHIRRYLYDTDALIDEYLTDQLLLPLALAGGGTFTARMISEHSKTQAWLIEQFLPVAITFDAIDDEQILVRITC